MNCRLAGSVALFVVVLFALDSLAQGTCAAMPNVTGRNKWKEYRINIDSLGNLDPDDPSPEQAWNAIVMAASVWNEQGNAAYFRVTGDTSRTSPYCGTSSYSVIHVSTGTGPGDWHMATTSYSDCKAELITIYTKNQSEGEFKYSLGHNQGGSKNYDFMNILVHEFGHVTGLDHPAAADHATMNPGTYGDGTDYGEAGNERKRRDLYQWDQKCNHEISGHRTLTAKKVYQYSNGSFSSPSTYSGSYGVSKTAVGTFGGMWLSAIKDEYDSGKTYAQRNFSLSNDNDLSIDRRFGIGPRIGQFWEEGKAYSFYSSYYEYDIVSMWFGAPWYDPYAYDSAHAVRYISSTDGFQTIYSHDFLRYCDGMVNNNNPNNMECVDYEHVFSGKPIAMAWNDWSSVERTMFAWVDQTRNRPYGPGESRKIKLTVGMASYSGINDGVLPEPDTMTNPSTLDPIYSNVTPGLACKAYEAYNGNDCILVYSDQEDMYGATKVLTFYVWWSDMADRYVVSNVSGPYSFPGNNDATGYPIAAWYHTADGGKFWVALKSVRDGEDLSVYSSSNGGYSWSRIQYIDTANVGPVATNWSPAWPTSMYNSAYLVYVK